MAEYREWTWRLAPRSTREIKSRHRVKICGPNSPKACSPVRRPPRNERHYNIWGKSWDCVIYSCWVGPRCFWPAAILRDGVPGRDIPDDRLGHKIIVRPMHGGHCRLPATGSAMMQGIASESDCCIAATCENHRCRLRCASWSKISPRDGGRSRANSHATAACMARSSLRSMLREIARYDHNRSLGRDSQGRRRYAREILERCKHCHSGTTSAHTSRFDRD